MEEYKTLALYPLNELNSGLIKKVENIFNNTEGVKKVEVKSNLINIVYNSFILSHVYCISLINGLGVSLQKGKKKKGFFDRILENLIKGNKDAYGNKKLDCCDLNH